MNNLRRIYAQDIRPWLAVSVFGLKRFTWLVGLMGAVILGLAVYIYLANSPVIDRSTVEKADFSVYAPKHSPGGYELLSDQTSLNGRILTYSLKAERGGIVTVTNQPRPNAFDISQMSKGGSISSIATKNGTLYDLSIGQSGQFLLDTGDALIYFTSPSRIDTVTISSIANDLHKLN